MDDDAATATSDDVAARDYVRDRDGKFAHTPGGGLPGGRPRPGSGGRTGRGPGGIPRRLTIPVSQISHQEMKARLADGSLTHQKVQRQIYGLPKTSRDRTALEQKYDKALGGKPWPDTQHKPPAGGRHAPGDRVTYTDGKGREHPATVTEAHNFPRAKEPHQYSIKLDKGTGRYNETYRMVPHSQLRKGAKGSGPAAPAGPDTGWQRDYVPPRSDGWTPDLTPAPGVKELTSPGRPQPPATGTAADPIDVKGDLDKALTLMHDGKHVRLNQVDEIAILLDKVDAIAKAPRAEGEKPPDWDFGLLTVQNTNLFTAQTKGIPRINMPQFSGLASPGTDAARLAGGDGKFVDLTPQLGEQLKKEGIKVTAMSVPASHLRATQTELVGSKVAGFANAVRAGVPKAVAAIKEPIYVTRDHYVVDGHHRWAANMMLDSLDGKLGNDTTQNVLMVDMDIGAMIPYSNAFAARMGIAGRGGVKGAAWLAAVRADVELGADPDVAMAAADAAGLGRYAPPAGLASMPFTLAAAVAVRENHPDCPADKPFGVAGPDGKVHCHATRQEAQDLALTLNFPDVDQSAAPGGVQVGAAKGGNADPAERMRIYWSHGEGAAKVAWGTPGDFDRCVDHVGKFMDNPQGYCAERHHDALGIWPATHAKEIREGSGGAKAAGPFATIGAVMARFGVAAAITRVPKGSPGGGQFGSGSGGATPTNAAPVQQGQSGQTVKFLQQRLNALGAKPPLKVDGKFGPLTLAAVKQYQASQGLKVDGLVGPLTTGALRAKIQKGAPAVTKKAPAVKTPATTTSKTTGGGSTTKAPAKAPAKPATTSTKAPAKAPAKPAPAGKTAAPAPARAPAKAPAKAPARVPATTPTPRRAAPAAPHPQIGNGASGAGVRLAQARLNAGGAGLAVDGQFGPKTLAAVEAFQRGHTDAQGQPLAVDGIIGPKTWGALTAPAKTPAAPAPAKPAAPKPPQGRHGRAAPVTYPKPPTIVHVHVHAGADGSPAPARRGFALAADGDDPDVVAFTWRHGWVKIGSDSKPAVFSDSRGGMIGRGGMGAHAANLAGRLAADDSGGDKVIPMSAGERRAARIALNAHAHPHAAALAGRIRAGQAQVPLSHWERGLLHDALTSALTGKHTARKPRHGLGITQLSPALAGAPGVEAVGPGGWSHGWKRDGPAQTTGHRVGGPGSRGPGGKRAPGRSVGDYAGDVPGAHVNMSHAELDHAISVVRTGQGDPEIDDLHAKLKGHRGLSELPADATRSSGVFLSNHELDHLVGGLRQEANKHLRTWNSRQHESDYAKYQGYQDLSAKLDRHRPGKQDLWSGVSETELRRRALAGESEAAREFRRRHGAPKAAGVVEAVGPGGWSHGWKRDTPLKVGALGSKQRKDHLTQVMTAHLADQGVHPGEHAKIAGQYAADEHRQPNPATPDHWFGQYAHRQQALGQPVPRAEDDPRMLPTRINGQPITHMSDYQLLAALRNITVGEVGHLAAVRKALKAEQARRAKLAAKSKRITVAERRALSQLTAIPESQIGPHNIDEVRRKARGPRAAAPDDTPPASTVQVPALVTVPAVDILAAGTWQLSTGRQTFTRGDLEQAVEAAKCPAIGEPVIKIGHLDQRFAPAPGQDGEPAIGKVTNLRLNDSGTKVLGDLAGMPGWLGAIAASAFPRRSVEGKYRFTCQIGHQHPFVLTALALLGVTPPGVGVLGQLDDIAALYGVTAAADPGWQAEQTQEGTVMPVTEEDVRRAWYAAGGAPPSWWITELQMAPAQLIVADEESGAVYRVPFDIEGSAVTFGDADEIVSYAAMAAARGTGPAVLYASAAESRLGLGVVHAAWDGAAAVKNLGDNPSAAQLKALFAMPGATKGDSSLPHHDVSPDGKVGAANPDACSAAIAALNGARGGLVGASAASKKAAHGHLSAHLRSAGKEPPDLKAAGDDEPGIPEGEPGSAVEWTPEDRLARLAAIREVAAAADADEDVKQLVASLDATLDQASSVSAGIDRSKVDADTGQALDLITAAEAIADQLMDVLGIYDPDDADDDGNESAAASAEVDAASGDAGPSGKHGNYSGAHSHPHPTTGDQGDDTTHEHMHRHNGDAEHDHAHDTQAAAPAAASQEGSNSSMGFEFTDQQMAAIRSRLGKKDGEPVTTEEVFTALDTPRAPVAAAAAGSSADPDVQAPQIGDGTYLVDGEILRKYQERAVAGDQALHRLHLNERDQILAAAVNEGKFSLARKPHFEALWDKDPEGTRGLVAKLAPGLVPMGPPLGFAGEFGGDPDMPGDFEGQQAYRDLYPDDYAREREQRRAGSGR